MVVVFIGIVSFIIFILGYILIVWLYEEKCFIMMGLMDFMFSLGIFVVFFFVIVLYGIVENWCLFI